MIIRCGACGRTGQTPKEWDERSMLEEYRRVFPAGDPDITPKDLAIVCDDCWKIGQDLGLHPPDEEMKRTLQ